jgi:hypothetical protein
VALAGEYGLAVRVKLDIDGKLARYAELLRELPAGLSEWAPQAREILQEEKIVVISYQAIQRAWSGIRAG